jgi:uncharacterized membrane protein
MKTEKEIEFEKFMDLIVERMKLEHRIFMWTYLPRLIAVLVAAVVFLYMSRVQS